MFVQVRQELERVKRRLETELNDVKEQFNEKKVHVEELQQQLAKKENELSQVLLRYADFLFFLCVYIKNLFNESVPSPNEK